MTPGPMVVANVDRAQVAALGGRRLGPDQLLDHRRVVLEQALLLEVALADHQVHDRVAVGAVLDLAGLGLLHRAGDVQRHGADLRVRHLARRAEDAAQAADDRHQVRAWRWRRRSRRSRPGSSARGPRRRRCRRRPPRPRAPCRPGRTRRSSRSCPGRAGSAIVPRSCSSAWRTFSPVRTCTSTDSLNLTRLELLDQRDRLGGLRTHARGRSAGAHRRRSCRGGSYDVDPHRAGGAGDDLRRGVDVVGVQILHLLLRDLAQLVLGDLAHLGRGWAQRSRCRATAPA